MEGFDILIQRGILYDLLRTARSTSSSNDELRAALWALGHICSSEMGFASVCNIDSDFMEHCIERVTKCANFSLRGVYFFVLGLIGRNSLGIRKLSKCLWDTSPIGGNSAVAIPRNPSILFRNAHVSSGISTDSSSVTSSSTASYAYPSSNPISSLPEFLTRISEGTDDVTNSAPQTGRSNTPGEFAPANAMGRLQHPPSTTMNLLSPFQTLSIGLNRELEVLNLIARMPGVILYRDSKNKLEALKKSDPELFTRRTIYVEVQRMFEAYTYKLNCRREIVNLFSMDAMMKSGLMSANGVSSTSMKSSKYVNIMPPVPEKSCDVEVGSQ